jgi:hypothetical protein
MHSCLISVIKEDIAVTMLGVLVDESYTPRPSNLAPILERLAKVLYSHPATDLASAAIDYS